MKLHLASLLVTTATALGGDFVNLTFDQPNLNGSLEPLLPGGPFLGRTADLLPGWKVRVRDISAEQITYSPLQKSSFGPVTLRQNTPANAATLLGFASLELHSADPNSASGPEIRLSQSGAVPADAAGLWVASAGYVQGYLNGTKIGEVDPFLGSHAVWNIGRYAGQEVNLEFLVRPGDSIRFDILGFVPIPEPSTWALFGVGALAVGWFCRGRRT